MPGSARPSRDESLAPATLSPLGLGRRLLDVGISPNVEEQLALRLRISNGLGGANVVVCALLAVQHFIGGRAPLALALLASAASWVGIPLANHFGLYRLSRVGVVLLFLVNILVYMGILGKDARLEEMCFAVSLLACFLFALDDWRFWVAGTFLSADVYFFGEHLVRPLFGPAMAGVTHPANAAATTFLELLLVAYVFASESRRSFRALRRETRALEAARAEALSAANAKSQFLATMSHELRTPLNGVIGMTQLLQLTRLDDEQREHLRTLAASSDYLMSLLDGVLDLNKLDAGRVDLERTTFQLSAAVDGVVSLLLDRAKQKGLTLQVLFEPGAACWVEGDQRRLQQILFNLVGNGIKFTEQGSVDVRVSRAPDATAPGRFAYELAVDDSGIGMSEEEMQQLFTPFTQANTTIARRFGGTGLGLAISHGLAVLMGGSLTCTSRPGKGSRFLLRLSMPEMAEPEKPAVAPAPELSNDGLGLGLRVLLAEDNIVNQKVVSAFLKVLGCEYEVVGDGLQVLDRLERSAFDVILMDCQMPELDGVTATHRIRQSGTAYATIPIIALTANVLDEERMRCEEAGMSGYLTKPLARAKLHDELLRYRAVRAERRAE